MTTATASPRPAPRHLRPAGTTSPARRFLGVVARPQSYRNIAYLLLGLPLGTLWFSVLVGGYATALSMVVVALIGIPMLVAMWYVVRAGANVERGLASSMLGQDLPAAPLRSHETGNLWVRLRSMSRDQDRWRELGYLLLRFPAGIATFTAAVTALTTPFMVASAPIVARVDDSQPFGDWAQSSRMEDAASSGWSWLLVPLGALLLLAALHLLNALAGACGRWATTHLGATTGRPG